MGYKNFTDTHGLSLQESRNLSQKCKHKVTTFTPALDYSDARVKGDALFPTIELADFFPDFNHAARIESCFVFDKSSLTPAMTLYLTTNSSNPYISISDDDETADAAITVFDDVQAVIPFKESDFVGGANYTDENHIAELSTSYTGQTARSAGGVGSIVQATNSSTSLYCFGILQSSSKDWSSGSASDLIIKIGATFF